MNVRWFTADTHLGHKKMLEFRPYTSTDEMNQDLIARWNAMVQPDDTIYHLGDVSLGKSADLDLVQQLNGFKILVCGNHDAPFHGGKRAGRWLRAGFDLIVPEARIQVGEETVMLTHLPYQGDMQPEDRYPSRRPVDNGGWLLHGHVHNMWRRDGRQINVGVDAWGGYPVPESSVVELVRLGKNGRLNPLVWKERQ